MVTQYAIEQTRTQLWHHLSWCLLKRTTSLFIDIRHNNSNITFRAIKYRYRPWISHLWLKGSNSCTPVKHFSEGRVDRRLKDTVQSSQLTGGFPIIFLQQCFELWCLVAMLWRKMVVCDCWTCAPKLILVEIIRLLSI